MKKLLLITLLFIGLAMPATVSAQYDLFPSECNGTGNQNDPNDPRNASACSATGSNPIVGPDGILTKVLGIFSFVVGAAAVIMMIFGGMKYISANGDATKLASARDTILYAMVGIAVFLSSHLIARFVLSKL